MSAGNRGHHVLTVQCSRVALPLLCQWQSFSLVGSRLTPECQQATDEAVALSAETADTGSVCQR